MLEVGESLVCRCSAEVMAASHFGLECDNISSGTGESAGDIYL